MASLSKFDGPIDAVVTWVNGADPALMKLMASVIRAGHASGLTDLPSGHGKARFKDNGEIEFCVRGIRTNMPWVRTIFLVTANQIPDFLTNDVLDDLGVQIVDHKTIFDGFDFVLPTFNSRSIETMLHRIPNLAARYIYFNDDFIPTYPSQPEDFFRDDNVVLRGEWKLFKHYGRAQTLLSGVTIKLAHRFFKKDISAHLLAQMRAAELAGFRNQYFHHAHTPHPVRVKTLVNFFSTHPDLLCDNIKYKFRNLNQFVTHPLAHHLEAANNRCIVQPTTDYAVLNFSKPGEISPNMALLESSEIKFVCLQNLEAAPERRKQAIYGFLMERVQISAASS